MKIENYFDLDAWKEGHRLVLEVYKETKKFAKDEMFGLTSRMRRAAVAGRANIVEGFSRRSWKEKLQFFSVASGSLTELHNQLFIARDVGYVETKVYESLQDHVVRTHRILNALMARTREFASL